jgi:hypothetical protein
MHVFLVYFYKCCYEHTVFQNIFGACYQAKMIRKLNSFNRFAFLLFVEYRKASFA